MASLSDDESEEVPLHRLRPFGTGLYNKKIAFVPAASGDLNTTAGAPAEAQGKAVSDLYLSMVLCRGPQAEPALAEEAQDESTRVELCEICRLPVGSGGAPDEAAAGRARKAPSHETTLAHQVCLTHSHPPSAVDRRRMGLSVLEARGWDADARRGLGPDGEGMRFPLKTVPKDDKLGLGIAVPKDGAEGKAKEKPKLLDAKKVRKMAQEDKKRSAKLRQELFGNVDLEKYLGKGAGG